MGPAPVSYCVAAAFICQVPCMLGSTATQPLSAAPAPLPQPTLHTQGHKAFVELLNDEIEEEKEIPNINPSPRCLEVGSWKYMAHSQFRG